MTKSAKSAWSALLVELAPVLAAFLLPVLLRRFMPAPPEPSAKGRNAVLVVLVLIGYAAFIVGTAVLVKLAWRLL